ncbi:MAG: hypothetical protein KA314_26255 [Chloroflexi bacterium]|nr:hypothetical protein [Chloroflexota bacterium]MBP8059353.1 hypothetical protein [Chloroflexota bacterium]
MTTVQTYQGVVHQGRIQLKPTDKLPEGSQVYVFMAEDQAPSALIDAHIARRKANGWLVTHVGSVIAQQPHLQQVNDHLVWRFKAFLATQGNPLRGPVGLVDVDAYSGELLNSEESATDMIAHATTIARTFSSPEG